MQPSANATARDAANRAVQQLQPPSTGLVAYHSQGRILIIGDTSHSHIAERLSQQGMSPELLALPSSAHQTSLTIEGYLGAFSLTYGSPPQQETLTADLILDLSATALCKLPLPPPGYFHHNGEESASLERLLNSLPDLMGSFDKPIYTQYDPSICAHSRHGIKGCQSCLDHCPSDAITSLNEFITIDQNQCQGGGICASVCPTGAIQYQYPPLSHQLRHLKRLLQTYLQQQGQSPQLIITDDLEHPDLVSQQPDNGLLFPVDELGNTGLDLWLSAITYGAEAVVLFDTGKTPAMVKESLQQQLRLANQLLAGFSLQQRIALKTSLADSTPAIDTPISNLANIPVHFNKRKVIFHALNHLYHHTSPVTESIQLDGIAPFGEVAVDTTKCTLCMSCTSVCPTSALQPGNDRPRLRFDSEACVQCGICDNACPEGAITLSPLLRLNPVERETRQTLHEEQPFHCIQCQKPFASNTMISTILSKLTDHPMFQTDRAKNRLQMCEDCRVSDAVQDEQAMGISAQQHH